MVREEFTGAWGKALRPTSPQWSDVIWPLIRMTPLPALYTDKRRHRLVVGAEGFEPTTPASQTRCSTGLSHAPTSLKVAGRCENVKVGFHFGCTKARVTTGVARTEGATRVRGPRSAVRWVRHVSNQLDTLPGGVEGEALHKNNQPSPGAASGSSRRSRN